jgi:hypothetical protein
LLLVDERIAAPINQVPVTVHTVARQGSIVAMPFITYFAGCATDLVAVLRQQGEETQRDGGGTVATIANDAPAAIAIATITTGHPRPPVYRRLERVAVTLNEPLSVLWFPRFVRAVGSKDGSRIVQLELEQGDFRRDGDGRLDADIDRPSDRDLEQFFGTVLPRHPALRDLHFLRCRFDRHVLRHFADPFMAPISAAITPAPTSPRIDLRFTETPLDRECAVLLQRMLHGGRIAKLVLEQCLLTDADSCPSMRRRLLLPGLLPHGREGPRNERKSAFGPERAFCVQHCPCMHYTGHCFTMSIRVRAESS